MLAVTYQGPGRVELADVPDPVPAPDGVVLRVVAAGVCHTDLHLRSGRDPRIVPGRVLGHEIHGEVVATGSDVPSGRIGEHAVVHPAWGCGTCVPCRAGRPQACRRTGGRLVTPTTPGITADGGMAEFVAVPASALTPADGVEPAVAATMTDAALSPYGAVAAVRDRLGPGSWAVVIGIGGLGAMAVQILRSVTTAHVIALDIDDVTLERHRHRVDRALHSDDPAAVEETLRLTDGAGADVVMDFVGTDATLALAIALVAPFGAVSVTGMAGGHLALTADATSQVPRGVAITSRAYSGSRADLLAVLDLARSGALAPDVTEFALADALTAFEALASGRLRGRAVLRPGVG